MSVTSWLEDCEIPSVDVVIALPNALYFLIKFRPDLLNLSEKTLRKRLAVYFWWDSIGRLDYPDLNWKLRPIDYEFINNIGPQDLIKKYPKCLIYWLHGSEKTYIQIDEELISLLLRADASQIPRFIRLLVDEREDLKKVFNLENITFQLACAEWWETIGKDQYPLMSEISFSPLLFSK